MGTGHRGGVGEEFTGLQRGPERLVQLGDELVGEANGHQHPHILRCCGHRKDPRYVARDDDSVGPQFDWYGNGDVEVTFSDESRVFRTTRATADFLNATA